MVSFLWVVTIIGCILGGLGIAASALLMQSAPQQAAGAAISVGLAVIPYCLARAAEGLRGR